METVTLSSDFAITLPESIVNELRIVPGQELETFVVDWTICLRPKRSLKRLRGIAKGMILGDDYRDRDDRF